jgi:hypothetical protein
MKIKNIEGLSPEQLEDEVNKGGRFVYYLYTMSLIVVTFKPTSGVYLVKGNESRVKKGWPFTLLSFFLGWWGIPYGPKYTIAAIRTNLKGGKDVTDEVMATIAGHVLFMEVEKQKARVV